MTYEVRAKRWSRGWELHIAGVGVTQSRTLDAADQQVRDYIETITGETDAAVNVVPELGEVLAVAAHARTATKKAAEDQIRAAAEARSVARRLREDGLSVSDVAHVLGVTRGRVSQLVK